MTDQELRGMIRESIARHMGVSAGARPSDTGPDAATAFSAHVSHVRFPLSRDGDDDGSCLVEPAVRCSHCGFCLSYGH